MASLIMKLRLKVASLLLVVALRSRRTLTQPQPQTHEPSGNTFMDTLNEHLKRKLSCDGMFEHPRALISWKDDFTRAYATNVFTCEANRCKLMKVTVAAAKVVPDLPAPRILATKPHENPDFLSPETEPVPTWILQTYNGSEMHFLATFMDQHKIKSKSNRTPVPTPTPAQTP